MKRLLPILYILVFISNYSFAADKAPTSEDQKNMEVGASSSAELTKKEIEITKKFEVVEEDGLKKIREWTISKDRNGADVETVKDEYNADLDATEALKEIYEKELESINQKIKLLKGKQ